MRTRWVPALLVVAVLAPSAYDTASASPAPDQGVVDAQVEVEYPIFPCNIFTQSCVAPVAGDFSGAVGGVDGDTPWAVRFEDASFAADLSYFNGPILTLTDYCFLEEAFGNVAATSSATATGTYGAAPVTDVGLRGRLHYIRTGDAVAIELAGDMELVLTLAGGQEVAVVEDDQAVVGAGTWTIVAGALPDCAGYDDQVALTARIDASMAMVP